MTENDNLDSQSVDEDEIITLAEEYLESRSTPVDPELKRVLQEKIETNEERLAKLDEEDPLYDAIERRIENKRDRLRELQSGESGNKKELLNAVADNFVAEGFWLSEPILEALNHILFGKYGESLVIERKIVEPDTNFTEDDLYEISMEIRNQAQSELELFE